MKQLKNWVLFACLFLSQHVFSQQAAYFILGEDQFRGVQIYDVIQDNQLNYWFTTSEGIYHFNYTTYEKIDCPKAKSTAVFYFVKDRNGVIYGHNLNRQIIKIEHKTCSVIYELKEDESGSDISLAIGEDGNLVVSSQKIIVLNASGKVLHQFSPNQNYISQPFTTDEGVIQYHLSSSDELVIYQKGRFSKKKLLHTDNNLLGVMKFMKIGTQYFAVDTKSNRSFTYHPKTFKLLSFASPTFLLNSISNRFYETSNGVWLAGTLPGVYHLPQTLNTKAQLLYADYFISDVFVDNEGNTLLSTFDKGVLVIPNLKVPDVIHPFREDPINSLFSLNSSTLLLGSSKGELHTYRNKTIAHFENHGKRPIEVLVGNKKGNFFFYDDGFIRGYNYLTKQSIDFHDASLKAVAFVNEQTVYLGTNRGLVQVDSYQEKKFKLQIIQDFNMRIHHLVYDSNHQLLYLSTVEGLIVRDKNGRKLQIQYKGEDLFPNDLYAANGKVYVCTNEFGVLVYKNGKFIQRLLPKVDGQTVVLKKMLLHEGTIIATGSNGFYQFDLKGNLLKSIHAAFGLSSKRVIDFTIHQGAIWLSHSNGVQKIDLNDFSRLHHQPIIRFDKLLVNGVQLPFTQSSNFSSDQRKFQFQFSSPTLRNRELLHYHYRLLGSDTSWNINPVGMNQVTFNALSPGTYVFEVKAESQGITSGTIRFRFEIGAPFYARWWFIVVSILGFIGIVYLIYRRQLAIQNRKAQLMNELNASKLTAIQSQMNPHFIFNSLNSIQDLILKGDVEHSYSYITTFSNLVRRTLNYSEKDFIQFEQEIKLLELYLSLEQLRFKKDFSYSIEHNNLEDILLPPLLVQPFIENALVHGLLHKEGVKKLIIRFELDEDVLICIIEDNGVGRERSKAIKARQRSEHESFSGKAIHNRFEILSAALGGDFGYHYEDLVNNGEALGTRVVLRIPIKHHF
ncbi:MAG: histidine kinase [Fluviicola sp.]|nr:histidine kinase [Fluviicola sp.]